jgi:sugar transferase (PEP-CTERM/EpsH1 system associated)
MKIVIIAPRFPFPLDKGDRLTVFHLLKYFSKRHQVSLVCFLEKEQDPAWVEKVKPFCEHVHTVQLRKWRAYANCVKGLPNSAPLQVHYHSDPAMSQAVRQLIDQTQPDLLYAHYIRMGQYIEPYREYPRVLAMQLSMTLNYRRLADHASNWVRRTFYSTEYSKLRYFEADFARRFDKVLLISKHDLRAVAQNGEINNVFLSPHGVDSSYFSPDPKVQKDPNSLIFTGNMNYMPNIDAAVYFCKEILPLVRKSIPDVRLKIVGTDPSSDVQALGKEPYVEVTGCVPDLRSHLNRAQIAIAPMRIAAGLLNKVLEGMSMELPMVITSVANEGIKSTNGKNVVVSDKAGDFASRIVELFSQPELRRRLGTAARDFVVKEWSWEKHFQDLEQMFCNLIEQFPRYVHHRQSPSTAWSSMPIPKTMADTLTKTRQDIVRPGS